MKKVKNAIISFVSALLLFSAFNTPVLAEEAKNKEDVNINETDPSIVFDEDEVDRLIELADQLPIENDSSVDPELMNLKSSVGSYPRRKGVILVTSDAIKGLIPTGHAGIIYSYNLTVESNAPGVEHVANNWYATKNQVYGVSVRSTSTSQDASAADYAKRQIGKPYNMLYYRLDKRDSFYCSQLVYAAFLDLYGIDLNTNDFDFDGPGGVRWKAIHPMELVNGSKTSLIYRMK